MSPLKIKARGNQGRKRGRPSTGFDKKAYMKEYMRKKRAEKKRNSVTNSNDGE